MQTQAQPKLSMYRQLQMHQQLRNLRQWKVQRHRRHPRSPNLTPPPLQFLAPRPVRNRLLTHLLNRQRQVSQLLHQKPSSLRPVPPGVCFQNYPNKTAPTHITRVRQVTIPAPLWKRRSLGRLRWWLKRTVTANIAPQGAIPKSQRRPSLPRVGAFMISNFYFQSPRKLRLHPRTCALLKFICTMQGIARAKRRPLTPNREIDGDSVTRWPHPPTAATRLLDLSMEICEVRWVKFSCRGHQVATSRRSKIYQIVRKLLST
mmetsp:Transcript_88761/g.147489  ORF Transcript_88761/g.147489 Transcript_88761/m.147489 type:complete len:260 (-) Transcript_88761:4410-5189(-)